MRLRDKVAVVSGSTSGIGRAIAERFAREGSNVLLTGRNATSGAAAERALRAHAGVGAAARAHFVAADLSRTSEVENITRAAVERWGRIDILVNNAATMTFTRIVDLDEHDWDTVLAVNLKAAFLLAKYAIPHMPPGSAIINVSSVHARATAPTAVPYAASKGGLEAFTRGLAMELSALKIRVNALRPGAIDTPMLWANPNVKSGAEKVDPTETGKPEDVAEAALFLACDQTAFITGSVLTVDGGRLAQLSGTMHG